MDGLKMLTHDSYPDQPGFAHAIQTLINGINLENQRTAEKSTVDEDRLLDDELKSYNYKIYSNIL
jgi:hypothetical protein